MPKGVEHERAWEKEETQIGVESLMPKGVEHEGNYRASPKLRSVESLMPKGVEHDDCTKIQLVQLLVSNL